MYNETSFPSNFGEFNELNIPVEFADSVTPTPVQEDGLINPIEFDTSGDYKFIPVDQWIPSPEDEIFSTTRGAIILPVYEFFGITDPGINKVNLNAFIVSTKRSYNSVNMRAHMVQYLNYFEKFYDVDHELITIYARTKYLIDFHPEYTKDAFFSDLIKYIMNGPIFVKLGYMNRDNYDLNLNYRNTKNPALQYTNAHGTILMKISLVMNTIIPLLCHFMYTRNVTNILAFLMEIYDKVIHLYDVDIYSKLYETAISNIMRNSKRNKLIWAMQDIRGNNETTHASQCVENIILNIIPKYRYDENLVHFNYKSILKNTGYQITDIGFEFAFVSLSSSKRDEDNNSEFDKFESFLTRADENLYLQNKVNAESTMRFIELRYGPFDIQDIEYYKSRYAGPDGTILINAFQKELVFNLFYKFFGDTSSINSINLDDYIKLIMAGKRILEANNLVILPYILSSKVVRLATRKTVNKKELTIIEASDEYTRIREKYDNEKIDKLILGILAQILSSDFEFVDPDDESGMNGSIISVIPELIREEVLIYVSLI